MAYKLKPNYHFSDMDQTGIDKVPVGRFIIVEDVGNENEIKWYKKVSDELLDELGDPDGQLDGTSTLTDALNGQAIEAPLDYKRDITDSYSITETDSILTLKRDITDSYSISDVDSNFRRIDDSYSMDEINTGIAAKQDSFVTAPTSSAGQAGDLQGQIAFSNTHIYYCTADYVDGLSDIWARVGLTLETW